MKNQILIFALLICISTSCKKNTSNALIQNGNYSGILEVSSSTYKIPVTYPITVVFENEKYKITPDPLRKEGGGSGTYTVNNNIGYFNDENVWPANFDGNLVLDGEYEIQSNGNSLILNKQFKGNIAVGPAVSIAYVYYKYILTKNQWSILTYKYKALSKF